MKEIIAEHPDYIARKALYRRYRDLYAGGEQLKSNGREYLMHRQKEPFLIYQERLSRLFYENYIGSIIDWYVATLFRREPLLLAEGTDEPGKQFLGRFNEDCDLRGTTITDFFRKLVLDALVNGTSYAVADFPRAAAKPQTRAEEEACGTARGYLVDYTADQLINWSHDDKGNYDWVVLRTSSIRKANIEDPEWINETRWFYYDKQRFEVYRSVSGDNIELVDSGFHGFAKLNRVPLFELKVPEGLWLMNRAGLLQLEHFNKSNALSHALSMGLFASPVIYSDTEWNGVAGDSYYIQLGKDDRFGWTEPEGRVFEIARDNLSRLQEEIYRVCYLMSQAGGPPGSGGGSSGLSKQRDFAITQEVLRAYGDLVKDCIKRVLRAIIEAREDNVALDVSGMDEFDIGDFSNELADAERLLTIGIDSPTLRKQVYKKLAFKYLCDVRQEVKDRIALEIETGVDSNELERR